MKQFFSFSRTILLLSLLVLGISSVWGAETTKATFKSVDAVSNSTYASTYGGNDWSINMAGNNKSIGFNNKNCTTIGDALGTTATAANYGIVVKSKNTIANVSKITFTYSGGSGQGGTIYLAYSTDNTNWSAITLNSGTGLTAQGATVASTLDNPLVFEFTEIASAYYAFILDKGNAKTAAYRFDNVEVNFIQVTQGGETPQPTALSVPSNLSSSNVTTTGATLSWDAVANASSYTVKIGTTEYTDVNTNSYSATGLTAETQYTWTVKAVGDGVNYTTSDYAANANFTTEAEQGGGDDPSGDGTTITFEDLGYASWGKSASFSGSTYDELSQTKSNVVFDYTRGSGSTYANTTSIRFYKDNQLKFSAPNGYKITSIVWTGSSFKDDVTTNVETCTSTTSALSWTGSAASVTFTRPSSATSYATLSSVSVTIVKDGGDTPGEPTLSSIAVATAPTKTTYTAGEMFDPAGLVITATYSEGDPVSVSYAEHASDFTFEPSLTTALTTSNKSVTITYGGKSTTQDITVNAASTPLSVPTNLASSNVTTTGATLTWDAVDNASNYTVKIGETEHTGVNTNSYSATGLTAGTQYTWTVKAVGDGVNYTTSAYAANANFTTEAEQGGGDEPTGEDIVIVFAANSSNSDGSTAWKTSSTIADIFSSGADYVNAISATNNVYPARNSLVNGVKFGTSSVAGSISFTLKNAVKANKIIVSAAAYGASEGQSGFTLNGIDKAMTGAQNKKYADYEVNMNGAEVSTITLTQKQASSGRIYVESITIVPSNDDPSKTTPTLSFANPTYYATIGEDFTAPELTNSENVTVSYTSSETGVATVDPAEGTVSLVAAGTTTITASFDGDATYNPASASYKLVVTAAPTPALTTMDEIFDAATTAGATATDCRVTFNNWVISSLNGTKNAYLTDNNGKGLIIYDNASNHGFETGDILSGTVACKVQLYNGAAELTTLTSTTEGLTITKGGTVTEQTIAIADLAGVNTGALVAYEDLTYHLNSTSAEFSDGENIIVAYKGIVNTLPELIEGKTYDIKGIFLMYNEKKEILPRSAEDIILKDVLNNYTVTIETPENGTLVVKNGEDVLASGAEVEEGTTLTIEVNNNRGYTFRNWQAIDGSTHTYTTTFTYTVSADVTIKANFDEIEKFTITLADDNTELTPEYGGESIVLPSRENVYDYTFAGWSETNIAEETTTAPTIIPAGEYLPTATMPLYPVYTRSEGVSERTVSVNVAEYAEAHEWTVLASGTATKETHCKYEIDLDANVKVTTNDNNINGAVYNDGWRIYQSYSGAVTVTTTVGELSSVKFTYTNANGGQLFYGEDQLTSATAKEVTGTDATFNVVRTTDFSKTNGQVKITAISVTYGVETTYYITTPQGTGTLNLVATDGNDYYATFSSTRAVEFTENVVYTVSVSGSNISLDEVASKQVPANTGVLIKSAVNSVEYTFIAEADALDANNRLMPGAATVAAEANHTYYRLAYYTGHEGLGFYYVKYTDASKTTFYSNVGGAYLDVETPMGSAPVRFVFGTPQTPTDIENLNGETMHDEPMKVLINGQVFILRGEKLYDTLGHQVK